MPFALPAAQADLLPFLAAAVTMLIGLVALFAPGLTLRARRLETVAAYPEAVAEVRGGMAGFPLGVGLVTLFFYDQPFVQMALGAAWLFTAFGRLVSILADGGSGLRNWLVFLAELLLALACLAPVFGLLPG